MLETQELPYHDGKLCDPLIPKVWHRMFVRFFVGLQVKPEGSLGALEMSSGVLARQISPFLRLRGVRPCDLCAIKY